MNFGSLIARPGDGLEPAAPEAWRDLAALAERHGLWPLLAWRAEHALSASGAASILGAPGARERIREAAAASLARAWELRRVLLALSDAGVRPILFKGAALAHTVYPDPVCRPMGDVDAWVDGDELPRAQAALSALGYAFEDRPDRPAALQALYGGEVKLRSREPGQGLIELHRSAFPGEWLTRAARVDEAAVRERAAAVSVLGAPARVLAREDAVIQIAGHLATGHQYSTHAARGLIDLAMLARAGVDWDAVVARARAWRLAAVTGFALELLVEMLGCEEARPAARGLALGPARRAWLRRLINPDAIMAKKPLSSTPWRYGLLFGLIDRPADGARLAARAIWPDAAWLRARYGRGGWRVRARHALSALVGRV